MSNIILYSYSPSLWRGQGWLPLSYIRLIRVIRVRFISERNYHNYHNYPRNTILSFYLTQISQIPQISFPFLFRYFSVSSVIELFCII